MTNDLPSPARAACPDHASLVDAALDEAADDRTLERYAAEVPGCAACRRALAGQLAVHPALLARAGTDGLGELAAALGRSAPSPLSPVAPDEASNAESSGRARRSAWWLASLVPLAAAAAGAWWWTRPPPPAPTPPPVGATAVAPAPAPRSPAPPKVAPGSEAGRSLPPAPPAGVVVRLPAPHPEAPAIRAPVEDDAVADAGPDWPPPPYEDLVGGTSKGISPLRAVQLVVSGEARVGSEVSLASVASAPTELQVCVVGPERGVVWRGRVPGGRTPLVQGSRPVGFAFAAPGTYRFLAATDAGVADCPSPVHVVEVEVTP